jgi:hypothetical protein
MPSAALLLLSSLLAAPAAQQACTSAAQIVDAAYRQVLERPADPASAGFVTALDSGRMTVRDVVAQLASSPEHVTRFFWAPLVTGVYRQMLNRDPSPEEVQQATAQLSGGSLTIPDLVAHTATRAANGEEGAVRILYRRLLGRDPDPGGLQSYTAMMRTQGIDAVARSIVASPEYRAHAGVDGIPSEDFAAYQQAVDALYRHLLGRAPDPGGLHDLTSIAIAQGVNAVVDQMVDSREYAQLYGVDIVPGHPEMRLCRGIGTSGR